MPKTMKTLTTYGLLIAMVLNALLWRFTSDDLFNPLWALIASSLLCVSVLWIGPEHWRRWTALLYMNALLLSIAPLIPGLWSCELSCSDGAAYAKVFGLPLQLWGAVSYALAALICLYTRLHAHYALILGSALAGCSLYYLVLSANLHMLCPNCMSIHSCVLAALCLQFKNTTFSRKLLLAQIAAAGFSAVCLFSIYATRSTLLIDADPIGDSTNDATNSANDTKNQSFADTLRQRQLLNKADAAYVIHCYLRIHCRHCSEALPVIIADIQEMNAEWDCAVQFHFLVDSSSQAEIDQAYLALASCLNQQQQLALLGLIGHNAQKINSAELLRDLELPVDTYLDFISENKAVFQQTLIESRKAYKSCRTAKIAPVFALERQSDHKRLRSWNGRQGWRLVRHQLADSIPSPALDAHTTNANTNANTQKNNEESIKKQDGKK